MIHSCISTDQQPGPSNEGQQKDTTTQSDQATGSSSTGGDNLPDSIDPFMALMNDETKRLQSKNKPLPLLLQYVEPLLFQISKVLLY